MTIRHGQFLQDVEVLEMMYRSLEDLRHDGVPKSRQWQAIMSEGPIDQIHETLVEMHKHLELPYPIPSFTLPADTAPPPRIKDNLDFSLSLDQLCRLYRAIGELRKELHPFRPHLYAVLAQQFLPHLYSFYSAMNSYLDWEVLKTTLAEMERQFASPGDSAVPPVASPAPQFSAEQG